MKKKLITADMTIAEIVDKYPSVVPVIQIYGLHCVGCGVSGMESIAEGVLGHGMTEDDLELILNDLNEAAEKEEAKVKQEKE